MTHPYLPHTQGEIASMLQAIGAPSIDALFADIPSSIRERGGIALASGLSEFEVERRLRELSEANSVDRLSFLGCGCYDHIIPAIVGHIVGRSEFATAYTPYQAEISQGLLQAIFEFQTMICELTGLDVSNASLYDGATAAAEACAMGLAVQRGADTILYAATLHPHTQRVLATSFADRGIRLLAIPEEEGAASLHQLQPLLDKRVGAVVVQSPNLYGYLEDYGGFAEAVHEAGALFVVSANPMSLGVVRSPAEWGADLAVGDTQVFGFPPTLGGANAGYIAAAEALLRKMPGRIVGQTVDGEGRRAFVLTLQAREQHIRRERATSNICTNQALIALGNAVYLAAVGDGGFRAVCDLNLEKSHYLFSRLTGEMGLAPYAGRPFFNEFTLRLPRPAREVLSRMEQAGIYGGVAQERLRPGSDSRLLTIAVTEKRTREELDRYVAALEEALR